MTDRLQIYSTVVAFQINMSAAQQAAGLFFIYSCIHTHTVASISIWTLFGQVTHTYNINPTCICIQMVLEVFTMEPFLLLAN